MPKTALWLQLPNAKKREAKAKKPVRKVSKSMAKKLREYSRLKKEFLARPENQWCPVMERQHKRVRTVDVHHKRGRGKHLLDVSTWLAVSRRGHDLIHANPRLAAANGWMLSRA